MPFIDSLTKPLLFQCSADNNYMQIPGVTPNLSTPAMAFLPPFSPKKESSVSPASFDHIALTPLAKFSISHQIQELSFQAGTLQFAYQSRDGSAAIRVSSSVSLTSRVETSKVSVVFSAEAVGLNESDFAQTGGPIRLQLAFHKDTSQLIYQSKTKWIKTLRKPEEILMDFAQALTEIARDDKGKLVQLIFDEEAFHVLSGDPKIRRQISELILFLNALNILNGKEIQKAYTIYLSGKGKPILDHQEKVEVETQSQEIYFELTILPPRQLADDQSASLL